MSPRSSAKETVAALFHEQARLELARGVRLQRDPLSGEPVLLFPEGILPLDLSSHDIVRLCDGRHTLEDIIRSLARDYGVSPESLRTDILDCIRQLHAELLVVFSQSSTTPKLDERAGVAAGIAQSACKASSFPYRPYLLLAELTYRCPLHCPYCSNPFSYPRGKELSTADWRRVISEAAELAVLHIGFSGGEPLQRPDLARLVEAARGAGLYSNLITSAIGLNSRRAKELQRAGLDSVQISFQANEAALANHIAGLSSHAQKVEAARLVRELGFPLTLNVVLHRANIERVEEIIALAESLGAERLELANAQYYGWAFQNRDVLLPTREQVTRAAQAASTAKGRLRGRMKVQFVTPDYYSGRPKPCMNGWGRRYLTVNPIGQVLPCPTSGAIDGLRFDTVHEKSLAWIWRESEAFNRFRGTDWMPLPCRDCELREVDFAGCRCQAALITGRADLPDPACALTPHHETLTRFMGSLEAGNMTVWPQRARSGAPFPFVRRN